MRTDQREEGLLSKCRNHLRKMVLGLVHGGSSLSEVSNA